MSASIPPTPDSTWYKPETPDDAPLHACYCRAVAVGRTTYWDGYGLKFRWQCRHHIPTEPAKYRAVTR